MLPRRGRASRAFSPDPHHVTNRAGQGKNDYNRTVHELASRPAGREAKRLPYEFYRYNTA